MIQISEAASLALHGMLLLAGEQTQPRSAAELAQTTNTSHAHFAKVMQRLTHAGLVQATRGPRGGYQLARPSDEITLLEVYEAIDGPVPTQKCLHEEDACPFKHCIFGGVLVKATKEFREYLAGHTLKDLA
ncbi:MAG TPA: Rrf2 family transcriptional regulator [Firmicutes bacterium]|jgi:Rrf2 family nitric oxide-sensitive transcriptional repressor|nr:Rrf2 family transcriptional regulator [Bacillota bacterium]